MQFGFQFPNEESIQSTCVRSLGKCYLILSSFSVMKLLKFLLHIMLERKDIMVVCLILLNYWSIQIPNFYDTLAMSFLSRLSETVLATPFPSHHASSIKKFKFVKSNSACKIWTVLIKTPHNLFIYIFNCIWNIYTSYIYSTIFYIHLSWAEDRHFLLYELLPICIFAKLIRQIKPSECPLFQWTHRQK